MESATWYKRSLRRIINQADKFRLIVQTDFGAQYQHGGTCSQDNFSNVAIFVVMYSPRWVSSSNSGPDAHHLVYAVDVWRFFASAGKRGVGSNYFMHNACMEKIITFYISGYDENGENNPNVNKPLVLPTVLTLANDGCPQQYDCRQMFIGWLKFPTSTESHLRI